jgi:hypothetical protein
MDSDEQARSGLATFRAYEKTMAKSKKNISKSWVRINKNEIDR